MYYFIILDDDILHIKSTVKRLEIVIRKHQLQAEIALNTTNPKEVIEYSKNNSSRSNIYLLDVDVKHDITGIDVASTIRKMEAKAYIIFISAYPEFVMPSLKAKIFDYLIKPVCEEMLETCIISVIDDFTRLKESINKKSQFLSIKTGFEIYHIVHHEIIYMEKYGHLLVIHTLAGRIESSQSLESIEQKLDKSQFFRCHKSYIVNLSHISRVDYPNNIIYLKSGDNCLVSKRSKKELRLLCTQI